MNYILFDGTVRDALLPFTFTRPVADIRMGILTIREKWEHYLGSTTTTVTQEYLQEKFPMVEMEENVMINASFLPNEFLVEMISGLKENQAIFLEDEVVAFFTTDSQEQVDFDEYEILECNSGSMRLQHAWDGRVLRHARIAKRPRNPRYPCGVRLKQIPKSRPNVGKNAGWERFCAKAC